MKIYVTIKKKLLDTLNIKKTKIGVLIKRSKIILNVKISVL